MQSEYVMRPTIASAEQQLAGLTPAYVQQRVADWIRSGTYKEVDLPEAVRNLRINVRRIGQEYQDHLLAD